MDLSRPKDRLYNSPQKINKNKNIPDVISSVLALTCTVFLLLFVSNFSGLNLQTPPLKNLKLTAPHIL